MTSHCRRTSGRVKSAEPPRRRNTACTLPYCCGRTAAGRAAGEHAVFTWCACLRLAIRAYRAGCRDAEPAANLPPARPTKPQPPCPSPPGCAARDMAWFITATAAVCVCSCSSMLACEHQTCSQPHPARSLSVHVPHMSPLHTAYLHPKSPSAPPPKSQGLAHQQALWRCVRTLQHCLPGAQPRQEWRAEVRQYALFVRHAPPCCGLDLGLICLLLSPSQPLLHTQPHVR